MALIDVVADLGDLCGECPLWSGPEQALYWSDISGLRLSRCQWPERKVETIHQGLEISGLALHESGGFVVVNAGGIWLWDRETKKVLVTDSIDNKKCALNDCIVEVQLCILPTPQRASSTLMTTGVRTEVFGTGAYS